MALRPAQFLFFHYNTYAGLDCHCLAFLYLSGLRNHIGFRFSVLTGWRNALGGVLPNRIKT